MKLSGNISQEELEEVAKRLILSKKGEYKYYDLLKEYQTMFDDSVQILKVHSSLVLAMDDLLWQGFVKYNNKKSVYENIEINKEKSEEELVNG